MTRDIPRLIATHSAIRSAPDASSASQESGPATIDRRPGSPVDSKRTSCLCASTVNRRRRRTTVLNVTDVARQRAGGGGLTELVVPALCRSGFRRLRRAEHCPESLS